MNFFSLAVIRNAFASLCSIVHEHKSGPPEEDFDGADGDRGTEAKHCQSPSAWGVRHGRRRRRHGGSGGIGGWDDDEPAV